MDKNGEGASKFAKGQRVVGVPFDAKSGNGTWKQFTVVKEECLVCSQHQLGGVKKILNLCPTASELGTSMCESSRTSMLPVWCVIDLHACAADRLLFRTASQMPLLPSSW